MNASPGSGGIFDVAGKEQRLAELNERANDSSLWTDLDGARKVLREKSALEKEVAAFSTLVRQHEDAAAALELAEGDESSEFFTEARTAARVLGKHVEKVELRTLFYEEDDPASAIVEINPGAGGTDAQDWADMLLRMYTRWAEQVGYKVELMDRQVAEEAGIKSATLAITGEYAFGYLKSEIGVHRLVRISPFDAASRRQTAFAAVAVYADIDDEVDVKIEEKDLRIDVFRSGGAGGQSVNTTDSAVRIVHIPSGIVVQCQNERSQHKNKALAMRVLRARLYEHYQALKDAELAAKAQPKRKIDFGSQIRSYVLAPYRLVKDLRTSHEWGNVDAVLDGELNGFMESWLAQRAEERAKPSGA